MYPANGFRDMRDQTWNFPIISSIDGENFYNSTQVYVYNIPIEPIMT